MTNPAPYQPARGPGGRFLPSGRPRQESTYEQPREVARRERRRAQGLVDPRPEQRDERGQIIKGTGTGLKNRGGRPKGAKDKIPRGSIKAMLQRLMAERNGDERVDVGSELDVGSLAILPPGRNFRPAFRNPYRQFKIGTAVA